MEKVKNPIGRVLIYLALILLVVYSVMPFVWSLLTSIKYPIEANNPKPKLFGFTPTMMNYEELWLYMEGSAFVPYAIAMLVLMIVIVVFAVLSVRLQWLSKPVTNMIAVGLFLVLLFVLPQVAQMSKFYDYFLNSLVVTVGTLVVSISIGCVGGYAWQDTQRSGGHHPDRSPWFSGTAENGFQSAVLLHRTDDSSV